MPEARFVIAGEGDLRPYQKQIANASNLEVINSYISDDQVAPLINKSSILVLPYTQASQSAVIPVAYAFEKPVVTTSVGCLMDVVEDGLTGLVVPPRDPQALAQAMLTLLGDPEMRRNCGRKGNQKMKDELGWDKIIEQTIQVYESSVVNFKS